MTDPLSSRSSARRFRRLATLFALPLAFGTAQPALGWGQTGHRVTGAIAERHLGGLARAQIRLILGDESLAEAATWADEMRSDPAEFWQKTANPWHYVTVPPGKAHGPETTPPEGDAVTALARFSATLRNPAASRAERQLALRFIVHIVGDLHQPFHAGNGRDKGGNDVAISFFGEPTNLHALWDSGLIARNGLSFSEYAGWLDRRIAPADIVLWWSADPAVWIAESAALRDGLYPARPDLSFAYAFAQQPVVDRRLQQAGIRIAAYLDRLFAK